MSNNYTEIETMTDLDGLLKELDLESGTIEGMPAQVRRLSDLRGYYRDSRAFEEAVTREDVVAYRVCSVEPANGDGQLHFGLGILYPGKIGDEYYLTKGHYHEKRGAAEVYIGLKGQGAMLLECETTGESRLVSLSANQVVYVPGHTAHRTVNTGEEPLVYLGVYPWDAGHDYGSIAERNFNKIVVDRDGQPTLLDRNA